MDKEYEVKMLQTLHRIGGLVVKLAVAIRDHISIIRPAPGSIPGRCMKALTSDISFVLLSPIAFHDLFVRMRGGLAAKPTLPLVQQPVHIRFIKR
jgi:hypothetical protein